MLEEQIRRVIEIKSAVIRNEHAPDDVQLIAKVYRATLAKRLNQSCHTCIIEAVYEIEEWARVRLSLTNNKINMEFKLKPGKLIHHKGSHYNNTNLTDIKVWQILNSISKEAGQKWLENFFSVYPKDWASRVKKEAVDKLTSALRSLKNNEGKGAEGKQNPEEKKSGATPAEPNPPAPPANDNKTPAFDSMDLPQLVKLAEAYPAKEWESKKASKKKMINYLIGKTTSATS